MRARLLIGLLVTGLSWPGVALANNAASSNWAGYAVHRAGLRFRGVQAIWRQPSVSCVRGHRTYSAYWVGLGGFNPRSQALEQIGTEVDCRASGSVVSSAWFELVPAPSTPIRLRVRPGDLLAASVTVLGHRTTLSLYDVTRHRGYRRVRRAPVVDVSSAEWIVEAPSVCVNIDSCQTLPLANFGLARFDLARAHTVRGHTGSISDHRWRATRIYLLPGARRFVGTSVPTGAAIPSPLSNGGSEFNVSWAPVSVGINPFFGVRRAGVLVHAGL